jgi:DNA-binding NtrC family response regulator
MTFFKEGLMKKKKEIKVLLVDDEVDFVDTLAQRLKMRELLVDTVYDGEQALSFIKKIEPDVIVLDLKMPGLHGIEVLREIKSSSPQIQVIILTGHGTEKDEDEAKRLGGFDFLRKPADIDLLVAKIKEAFMEKVERAMTAVAFAEEGDLDRAQKIIKKEE